MMKITCEELKNKYMDMYENHRDQVRYRALLNAEPGQKKKQQQVRYRAISSLPSLCSIEVR